MAAEARLLTLFPRAGRGSKGRWRAYDYEDLISRDKACLDIFWLKDESLSESDNLPAPDVTAAEIVEDLEGNSSGRYWRIWGRKSQWLHSAAYKEE